MKHLAVAFYAFCVLCGGPGAADLGSGGLVCYGAKDIASPQIAQMAREGARPICRCRTI